jgi:crossover junction endodeoxyribonuclease RuvC
MVAPSTAPGAGHQLKMIIAGVDIGLSGAVALLDAATGGVIDIWDMPTLALTRGGKNKRDLDPHSLAAALGRDRIAHAFVEQVGAMSGQGVSSVFAFGKSYGITIGVLATLGVPMTFVSPQVWKKALGVPAAKDGARARASQLLPSAAHHWSLVKHDGRAEAALIAYHGLRTLNGLARAA